MSEVHTYAAFCGQNVPRSPCSTARRKNSHRFSIYSMDRRFSTAGKTGVRAHSFASSG